MYVPAYCGVAHGLRNKLVLHCAYCNRSVAISVFHRRKRAETFPTEALLIKLTRFGRDNLVRTRPADKVSARVINWLATHS